MEIALIITVGVISTFTLASENDNLQITKSVMETGSISISQFGAVGDGKVVNTSYIQKAIDTVSNAGGGTVIIPAGKYLTGTIQIKDNVILYLSPGSILVGSTGIDDYPELKVSYRSYTDNYSQRALIFAEKQQNIGIFGYGKIYGQGEQFKEDENAIYKFRPYLIRFVECKNVNLDRINFENGAMWTIHLLACENVNISNIKINSRCNRNNDGIDIDSCNDVIVSDCHIISGDDSIVLKSTSPKSCKNITITNCVLSSLCNALKMGTESNGGFQNITINNCTIYDTPSAGIALETVDGGITENISVNNISMQNVKCPIFIRLGNRARPCCPDHVVNSAGMLGKIIITNIVATGADSIGCAISGIQNHYIEELTLRNINISFAGGINAQIDNPPEKENKYPSHNMFGTLPAFGFFIRHVNNLFIDNMTLKLEQEDKRPALQLDDVKNPIISNISVLSPNKNQVPVVLKKVEKPVIKDLFVNGIPKKSK